MVYAKTAETIEIPFRLRTRVGPGNHILDGVDILGRRAHCKHMDFLPWAVQERLNGSICRLHCGLGLAERSTSSIVFARLCQCTLTGGHIDATWRIRLSRPSAAAMRSYVKLLCPFVASGVSSFIERNIRWYCCVILWILRRYDDLLIFISFISIAMFPVPNLMYSIFRTSQL